MRHITNLLTPDSPPFTMSPMNATQHLTRDAIMADALYGSDAQWSKTCKALVAAESAALDARIAKLTAKLDARTARKAV